MACRPCRRIALIYHMDLTKEAAAAALCLIPIATRCGARIALQKMETESARNSNLREPSRVRVQRTHRMLVMTHSARTRRTNARAQWLP